MDQAQSAKQLFRGAIVRDDAVFAEYDEPRALCTPALRIRPVQSWSETGLVSFTARNVLLTSCFVSIDTATSRMFLNQSYSHVEKTFATRFAVNADEFSLESKPLLLSGRYVVLGGPIDTVWYHWLFNWCPRLLVLAELRPDLLRDPAVRFLVHPLALREPYRSVLDTFDVPPERLFAIDPEQDYLMEEATLVSFIDQDVLFPDIVRAFADQLLAAWDLADTPATTGMFASRQSLRAPKRRVDNFHEIEPILAAAGLQVIDCGALSAAEQARAFRGATIIVGGHGSDLSNLLFCRPGTKVVVFESQWSINAKGPDGLRLLCGILELDYTMMLVETVGHLSHDARLQDWINQDYFVNPAALIDVLTHTTAFASPHFNRTGG